METFGLGRFAKKKRKTPETLESNIRSAKEILSSKNQNQQSQEKKKQKKNNEVV